MKHFAAIVLSLGLASAAACQKAEKDSDSKATSEGSEKASASRPTSQPAKPGDLPAPEDVAAPPKDALKTENGVFYKVITAASAPGLKPAAEDTVEVHYTGWTTDGKMFDSSKKREKPTSFALNRVIPGWTEGLQVMTEGETTRFWIPEEMAYKGRPGSPQGMLVFDVELLKVTKPPQAPEDVAKAPADAKKSPLGVPYTVLTAGSGGETPDEWDRVKVHYSGWTTDGKLFDSSITRGRPSEFGVNGVIPGWTDVLKLMTVGDKWRVWIPEEHAYQGKPGRPQGTLVFDVELLEISDMPKPPETPADVAKPPKSAKKTDSGVFYKVLEEGEGGPKPSAEDTVEVHYTGWTTDGKMFDSSITRGRTVSFPLTSVIKGWTDGVQVMSVGDKMRFWIPEKLAYQGKPGKPAGMLVFDIELVSIKE